MEYSDFTRYDHDKLAKAKSMLLDVLYYHYGNPRMTRKLKRLETIIAKLEVLQNLD